MYQSLPLSMVNKVERRDYSNRIFWREFCSSKSFNTTKQGVIECMSDFSKLSKVILKLHNTLQQNAIKSVNRMLTVRNWLIGRHIVEYEQNGADRAKYGLGLLESLSEELKSKGVEGISVTALRNYRQFYTVYPHLSCGMNDAVGVLKKSGIQIHQTPSDELLKAQNLLVTDVSPSSELLKYATSWM